MFAGSAQAHVRALACFTIWYFHTSCISPQMRSVEEERKLSSADRGICVCNLRAMDMVGVVEKCRDRSEDNDTQRAHGAAAVTYTAANMNVRTRQSGAGVTRAHRESLHTSLRYSIFNPLEESRDTRSGKRSIWSSEGRSREVYRESKLILINTMGYKYATRNKAKIRPVRCAPP